MMMMMVMTMMMMMMAMMMMMITMSMTTFLIPSLAGHSTSLSVPLYFHARFSSASFLLLVLPLSGQWTQLKEFFIVHEFAILFKKKVGSS